MRRQTQPRYFTANRTAKFNCIQGFFDVQFPGPPLSIHAAIIVNAIRQVGVFLNFAEHHTWPNRVGRACWHEKCVAGLHAPVNKHFLELLTFDGVHKLVSVGFGNKSDEYMRLSFGRDCMPHFRFAAAAGGLFVSGSISIVRMNLDGKLVIWKDELDQDGKVAWHLRSEEHTSELQSRVDLVCRLLLEKKKEHKSGRYQPK